MSDLFDTLLSKSRKMLSSEQMRCVNSRVATVVSAGAGSGKTTVLSFRFLKLVLDGIDADRILTLTFTKKAAAEMYERIHVLLSLACEEDPSFSVQLSEKFPKAHISTMDSFWTEIARTDCMKYGILRDFSIMGESDLEQIVNRIMNDIYASDEFNDVLTDISDQMQESTVKSAFLDLARNSSIVSGYSHSNAVEGFYDFVSIVNEVFKYPEDRLGYALDVLGEFKATSKSKIFCDGGDFDKAKEAFDRKQYSEMPKMKKLGSEELKFAIGNYQDALNNTLTYLKLKAQAETNLPFAKLFIYFISALNKEKRRLGLLTFKDVQATAKKILLENKSVRDYYKSKFDFIMIDEFQDNDSEQKEMLYLLSERYDLHTQGIPKAEDLDNRKLFFVGDDKQSIYLFRGADVSVFNNLKMEVVEKMHGLSLSLGANYRSEPRLVNHFNEIFSHIFEEEDEVDDAAEEIVARFSGIPFSSFSASASDILAGRNPCSVDPVIELDVIEKASEDDGVVLSLEESEAEAVGDKILEILSDSAFMLPDKNGGKRAPTFDDIGVLYPKTKTQMPIERALRRRGIPYTVMESTSVTLEGLAYDIYSFLQLLVYPNDKTSFMDVLASPFARISNEGLKSLIGERSPNYFSCEMKFKNADDTEKFGLLKALYEECMSNVGRESICRTLERLYYESGYRTYLLSSSFLSEYDEHFSYLWTMASNMDRDGGNVISYLDYLRPLIGKAQKLSELNIQRLNSSGVKMMTIHKSKGLEFPIVIIAGTGSKQKNQESRNCIVDTIHNGSPYLMYSKEMAKFFNDYKFARIKAERKRVLYVALTRAVNHLVITAIDHLFTKASSKNNELISERSMYMDYSMALKDESVIVRRISPYHEGEIRVDSYNNSFIRRHDNWYSTSILATPPDYKDIKVGVKAISHEEFDFSSSPMGEALPSLSIEDILSKYSNARADFGTLVHGYLECISRGESFYDFHTGYMSDKDDSRLQQEARNIALMFPQSDFYSEYVADGLKLEPELRFYFYEDGLVLEGSADLLVFHPEYNLVIDYKTDGHRNPEMHKGQITRYARALSELYKKPCYGIVCYVRDFSAGPIWDINGNVIDL